MDEGVLFPVKAAFPDYELETRGPVYLRGTSLTAARSLVSPCLSTTYHRLVSCISQCLLWEDNAAQTIKVQDYQSNKNKDGGSCILTFWFMVIYSNTGQVLGCAASLSSVSSLTEGHPPTNEHKHSVSSQPRCTKKR